MWHRPLRTLEAMTEPTDPWSVRPGQGGEHPGVESYAPDVHPTEHVEYTADPTVAYGTPPTPTMAYPTYESLREQQLRDQYAGAQPGYTQVVPQPPRRSPGMMLGIGVGVGLLLAAVVGVGIMVLGSRGDSSNSAASDTSSFAEPPQGLPSSAPTTEPPRTSSHVPLGGVDAGGVMGSVESNDGSTLTVRSLLAGSTATVHTTPQTQVVSMNSGARVADLKVGDMIIVQGQKSGDGSITARLIISTSLGSN